MTTSEYCSHGYKRGRDFCKTCDVRMATPAGASATAATAEAARQNLDWLVMQHFPTTTLTERVGLVDVLLAMLPEGAPTFATEPFVVKHYVGEDRPSIKGNGFDGLQVGEEREDAQEFVDWINARLLAKEVAGGLRQIGWARQTEHGVLFERTVTDEQRTRFQPVYVASKDDSRG